MLCLGWDKNEYFELVNRETGEKIAEVIYLKSKGKTAISIGIIADSNIKI